MLAIIAILVFVVVALGVFAVASLFDQRSAQARMLRERLATVQEASSRQPSEELALLRDEMLSKIPALDTLLRRSTRISNLQPFLEQANLKIRAGNILVLCVVSALALALVGFLAAGSLPPNQALLFALVGLVLGGFLPYSYASYRRTKRFQKFEELFP
jgi:Flp pilus assembly protein TadB